MKTPIIAITVLAAGTLLARPALAQTTSQTPPAKAQTSSATKTTHPAATSKTQAALTLKTQKEKASYAVGLNMGKGMRKDAVDIDPAILLRGIKDGIAGTKPLLTDAEIQAVLSQLQADVGKRQQAAALQAGETNKIQGDEFLAANKSKPGVVTLPSGLQYKILKEGNGPKPTAGDSVVCNYAGTLIDGKEFDSSYKRGQPVTFPVGQVIKGWTEALQLMPVGSKWQLFIPSNLAYGDRGAGPDIGPGATLIFEVELISIQGKGK
jgi:FKBP-type peptidyl-prolyl cis-trans isomerase